MAARKILHDSIIPLPAGTGAIHNGMMINTAAPAHGEETMPLLFSLALPASAAAELEDRVARGEIVNPADLRSTYSVPGENVDALIAWLKSEGFEITRTSIDGTSVYARATVSQIQQSLEVDVVRVTRGGITYTAARNAPSLPADVGDAVLAIIGLQPFRQARKHSRRFRTIAGAAPGGAGAPAPAATVGAHRPPYMVQDLLGAYNAASLGCTGAGQTIAILIDKLPSDQDVESFWMANGIPVDLGRIEKIDVNQVPLDPPDGEETLDVEWASGIASGARIRVYACGSLEYVYLNQALNQILEDTASQPGMRQLSMSMGLGETYLGSPQGEVAAQHQTLLKLAAAGVNVFVSSGDAGSNPDAGGHSATGPTQVEYGASDPTVVSVGGTTLALAADGTVAAETGWAGSGGGKSMFFPRPSWQNGVEVPGTTRLVPDVSLVADPGTGAFLVLNGTIGEYGGTSWAAPVWAGFCALMNEARTRAGRPALPFLNPLLYPLLGTAAFRDITQGSNGAYDAGPGYDMVTGLGVPDVTALLKALP